MPVDHFEALQTSARKKAAMDLDRFDLSPSMLWSFENGRIEELQTFVTRLAWIIAQAAEQESHQI